MSGDIVADSVVPAPGGVEQAIVYKVVREE